MASIDKRGGRWQVRWRDPDGRARARTCHTADAAKALKREIERAHDLGRRWEPESDRPQAGLAVVAQAWLTDLARTRSARTVVAYGGNLDLLTAYLERAEPGREWLISDLTRDLLSAGWSWLRAGGQRPRPESRDDPRWRHWKKVESRSIGTCNDIVSTWALLWAWAADSDDYADLTPRPRRIELPTPPRAIVPAATWAEVDEMLTRIGERPRRSEVDWVWRTVLIGRYTGQRHAEILALDWDDVDLSAGWLTLRPETTKGGYGARIVPIHPALAAEMAGWGVREGRAVAWTANKLAAAEAHVDGEVANAWAATSARVEVWRRRPVHSLRRCLRTHLVAQGVHGDVVDLLLGHQAHGTGGRVYTDPELLRPQLRAAILTVPEYQPTKVRRLAK